MAVFERALAGGRIDEVLQRLERQREEALGCNDWTLSDRVQDEINEMMRRPFELFELFQYQLVLPFRECKAD